MQIFEAAKAPIEWDVQIVGKEVDPRTNSFVTRENLDSVLVRPASTWSPGGLASLPRATAASRDCRWGQAARGRGCAQCVGRRPFAVGGRVAAGPRG